VTGDTPISSEARRAISSANVRIATRKADIVVNGANLGSVAARRFGAKMVPGFVGAERAMRWRRS
jgi:hypothetical protein